MLHYLGPSVGNVPLSTWDEVVAAAASGLFEETQWVELKERLGPAGKPVNTELARDLASLSVHGGVLVLGVRDKTFEVVGCDVEQLTQRISQVASMTVHPPLSPVVYPAIQHPEDEGLHVLVVEVPPSANAPHMVDNAYWGRSSDGKRKLSDPEVRTLMASRGSSDEAFLGRLLGLVEEDPLAQYVDGHPTGQGHIYLLAEPCAPVIGGDEADYRLIDLAINARGSRSASAGTIRSCSNQARDPLGEAVSSIAPGDVVDQMREEWAAYLVCHDDRSLVFVSGGGTFRRNMGRQQGEDVRDFVGSWTTMESVLEFFDLVRTLSLEHWGYAGQWRIGIHVTGLQGKAISTTDFVMRQRTFPRPVFTSHVVTSPAAWEDRGEAEAERLIRGYLRAIGKEHLGLREAVNR